MLKGAQTGTHVCTEMQPQRAALARQEHLEVPTRLGGLDDTERVLLSRDRDINGIITRDLQEHAGIRSALVGLPGRMQEARTELQACRDALRAEDVMANGLQIAIVGVVHLDVGEQCEVVAAAKSIDVSSEDVG